MWYSAIFLVPLSCSFNKKCLLSYKLCQCLSTGGKPRSEVFKIRMLIILGMFLAVYGLELPQAIIFCFVFWRYPLRISTWTPLIVTDIFVVFLRPSNNAGQHIALCQTSPSKLLSIYFSIIIPLLEDILYNMSYLELP